MKISNRQLMFLYLFAVCVLTIYTLTSIKECEAYWMHDESITITKQKLLADTSCLFLLPFIILLVQIILNIKTRARFFLTHFFVAATSMLLLVFAINKPCENVNDGHYMFIDSTMTLGYYLFKLISVVIIGIIIIQTIILKKKTNKTGQV